MCTRDKGERERERQRQRKDPLMGPDHTEILFPPILHLVRILSMSTRDRAGTRALVGHV